MQVYCKAMESDLVTIQDQSEQNYLNNYLTWYNIWPWFSAPKHHLMEKAEYWMGAMDMSTESLWWWIPQGQGHWHKYWLVSQQNQ